MDVVALQEVRWPYEGKTSTKNYQIYYSGSNQGHFQKGVAVAVRNGIDSSVISFEAVNDRICTIRLGKFKNMFIISFYEAKDLFYETLEEVCNNIPTYDVKILLGDANAKVGRETMWNTIAGKESLHLDSNNNGIRLLSLALSLDFKVVSTLFPRRDIHKVTWNSPTGLTNNQIDHVLIDNRQRSIITNVRSIRGAECGSDHNLVLVKIYQRLAIEKRSKTKHHPRVEIEKLKHPLIARNFRRKIQDNLITMFEEPQETGINQKWEYLRKKKFKKVQKRYVERKREYPESYGLIQKQKI